MNSIYALLYEFPSSHAISKAHLTRLTNLLNTTSKGHYTNLRSCKQKAGGLETVDADYEGVRVECWR